LEEGEAEAENYPWAVAEVEVANRSWAIAYHRTRKTNYFPRFVCDNRDNTTAYETNLTHIIVLKILYIGLSQNYA
jgi:hypothetical protein